MTALSALKSLMCSKQQLFEKIGIIIIKTTSLRNNGLRNYYLFDVLYKTHDTSHMLHTAIRQMSVLTGKGEHKMQKVCREEL